MDVRIAKRVMKHVETKIGTALQIDTIYRPLSGHNQSGSSKPAALKSVVYSPRRDDRFNHGHHDHGPSSHGNIRCRDVPGRREAPR